MTSVRRVFLVLCVFAAVFSTQVFASNLPEWDGVYLRSQDGSYEEMKPVLSSVRISTSPQGDVYYTTTDYTVIPASKFKGIYIKGKDFTKQVTFFRMRRDTEMSWGNLFSRKQGKFIDRFVLESNRIRFTPRSRQEGTDGFYYEPLPDALHFFGAADEGRFVHLIVGNGTYYIFGIGASEGTEPAAAPAAAAPERGANAQ